MGSTNDKYQHELNMAMVEWRGKTIEALSNISKDIGDIKGELKIIRSRMDKLTYRVAGIGASVAIIVTLILKFLLPF